MENQEYQSSHEEGYTFIRTDNGHAFNVGNAHNTNTTGITITSNGSGESVNGVNSIVSGEQLDILLVE